MANDSSTQVQPFKAAKRFGCLITVLFFGSFLALWSSYGIYKAAASDHELGWLFIITLPPGLLFIFFAIRLWHCPSTKLPLGCSEASMVFVVLLLVFCQIETVPTLLSAIPRGKQRKTMDQMKLIGQAMQKYFDKNHRHPTSESLEQLKKELVPEYIDELPVLDGWGRPFQYRPPNSWHPYLLVSAGQDGIFEVDLNHGWPPCYTPYFESDIVYAQWAGTKEQRGVFIREPSGKQSYHGTSNAYDCVQRKSFAVE